MDISEIRKMIRSKNDKVIIIEEGKPVLVVAVYEAAQNRETRAFSEQEELPASPTPEEKEDSENLTLKDLPFL